MKYFDHVSLLMFQLHLTLNVWMFIHILSSSFCSVVLFKKKTWNATWLRRRLKGKKHGLIRPNNLTWSYPLTYVTHKCWCHMHFHTLKILWDEKREGAWVERADGMTRQQQRPPANLWWWLFLSSVQQQPENINMSTWLLWLFWIMIGFVQTWAQLYSTTLSI